ncbi:hypothetical protein [Paenibacillus sp. RC67]|uniref:hypothetical protein n=1 Tax=Paenibacillus sp. RC67 TaxID=3039392 RepID=UPI0024ACD6ED|nr:hypothetical protein [Paenibacillus sp. RC67]
MNVNEEMNEVVGSNRGSSSTNLLSPLLTFPVTYLLLNRNGAHGRKPGVLQFIHLTMREIFWLGCF